MEGSRYDTNYLADVASRFCFEGKFLSVVAHGTGHINDTYAVTVRLGNGEAKRYILQRINHEVFKNPAVVMDNLAAVTGHLREKIIQAGGDPLRETINLIPTRDGSTFLKTDTGDTWRAETFIEEAQTYPIPGDPAHYYHAAAAFGRFARYLEDFPIERLQVTIPDFHNTPKRLTNLLEAITEDRCGRVGGVRREIEFFEARAGEVDRLARLEQEGALPLRVTHNDTKFENVMIDDETGEGICVIDLDTVMPGLVVFDFGDAVRSGANPAAEDEPDLEKVQFDIGVFERLANGYLAGAQGFLTRIERDNLAFAARLITLEQGMRFLSDYLNGDVYYRTQHPRHNLDRCRTQVKMVEGVEAQFERMEEIVFRTGR